MLPVPFENHHGQRSLPFFWMHRCLVVYWLVLLTTPFPHSLFDDTLRLFETRGIGEEATLHLFLPLPDLHLGILKPSLWGKALQSHHNCLGDRALAFFQSHLPCPKVPGPQQIHRELPLAELFFFSFLLCL